MVCRMKSMKTWKLAEAKSRFCEVAERAANDGPQKITRGGKPFVVIISFDELEKLTPGGVAEFFAKAPPLDDLADMVEALRLKDE